MVSKLHTYAFSFRRADSDALIVYVTTRDENTPEDAPGNQSIRLLLTMKEPLVSPTHIQSYARHTGEPLYDAMIEEAVAYLTKFDDRL